MIKFILEGIRVQKEVEKTKEGGREMENQRAYMFYMCMKCLRKYAFETHNYFTMGRGIG
jgi:ribosomal protein L34E